MGGWRSMDLDVVDLIYYLRSYQQILKYINLEPKETTPLGSCIGTWNELLGKERKKKESGAGGSALSAQLQYPGLWFDASALASPHPSSVSSPCRPSVSSVVRPVWVQASSLGYALCRWVLPSVVGLYPSSLGSTLRRWVLPFIIGFHPSSLCSTLRRWVLPLVVGFCLPSLGSTPRCRGTLIDVVAPISIPLNRMAVVELIVILGGVAGPWSLCGSGGEGGCCVGLNIVSVGRGEMDRRKRKTMTDVVACVS